MVLLKGTDSTDLGDSKSLKDKGFFTIVEDDFSTIPLRELGPDSVLPIASIPDFLIDYFAGI